MQPCLCHSGRSYAECCKPFHTGKKVPETAEQLMRSRYSAYALGLTRYIVETDLNPSDSDAIGQFSKMTQFVGLRIEETWQEDDRATVTFFAELRKLGNDASFREKSLFIRKKGVWYYAGMC